MSVPPGYPFTSNNYQVFDFNNIYGNTGLYAAPNMYQSYIPTYINSPCYPQYNYNLHPQITIPPPYIPFTHSSSSPLSIVSSPSSTTSSSSPNNQIKSNTDFKIPSGKDRTKPYDKDVRRNSSLIGKSIIFKKSSLIELENGDIKRVEDIRTEDFTESAEKSAEMKLTESTVNKIMNGPKNVIITLSYDINRSSVDVEVSPEHPFFVYGQGWASCSPDITLKTLGLYCQRLRVGDICISVMRCEAKSPKEVQLPPPSFY